MSPPRRKERRPPRRRPMGWVEVLVFLFFGGVLLGVAFPRIQEFRDGRVAREALVELEAIRAAATEYRAFTGSWPADGSPGFSVEGERFRLEWVNWSLPDGLPRRPELRVLVGVALITDQPRVAEILARSPGLEGPWYALGNRYTFILEGL